MFVVLMLMLANAVTEKFPFAFAEFTLSQGPRFASEGEGEWWAATSERMAAIESGAQRLGLFRPQFEIPLFHLDRQAAGFPKPVAMQGFINVIRMRAQGVIGLEDLHPKDRD